MTCFFDLLFDKNLLIQNLLENQKKFWPGNFKNQGIESFKLPVNSSLRF
ncbi:hypothetical protein AQPE_2167 [Aquipluma nitroreducens]|uniref:Uncharacterized protein n=1 Tax=Aquipluma nitroreducens TaxID=2010828 RepID=A0A5K7S8X0_9BACT|nr:hypothetical protein AQPE_2167 [Aquipluma nitroreducens]